MLLVSKAHQSHPQVMMTLVSAQKTKMKMEMDALTGKSKANLGLTVMVRVTTLARRISISRLVRVYRIQATSSMSESLPIKVITIVMLIQRSILMKKAEWPHLLEHLRLKSHEEIFCTHLKRAIWIAAWTVRRTAVNE